MESRKGWRKRQSPQYTAIPTLAWGCLTEKYKPVTVHGLSSEVKISHVIQPHNTNRIHPPNSHTIQTGYLNHTATQYKQDTSTVQPHNTNNTPQPQSHTIQKMVPQAYSHTI
jgi:hypothetical protein